MIVGIKDLKSLAQLSKGLLREGGTFETRDKKVSKIPAAQLDIEKNKQRLGDPSQLDNEWD